MFLIPDVCSSLASIFSFIVLTKKLHSARNNGEALHLSEIHSCRYSRSIMRLECWLNDGGSQLSWTDGAKDSAACTLTDTEHMGVGQSTSPCASASTCISYIDVTDVRHVGG